MRIAFVTSQFPPDTAIGGIATYVEQVARMLAARGHEVEVFAGSGLREETESRGPLSVHWLRETDFERFPARVADAFARRHAARSFDVVEAADFQAEARVIAQRCPAVPVVVKMHTPTRWVWETTHGARPAWLDSAARGFAYARMVAGACRRFRRPPQFPRHSDERRRILAIDRIERTAARRAALVLCPSRSIMRLAASRWHLPAAVLRFVPNVYSPPPALLALPLERAPLAVGFFGRLEALKGIVDLAAAWPRVLARCPGATLRLVGRPMPLPESRGLADAEFRRVAGPACAAVEFRGHRPLAEIPAEFAHVSVSVIPSHWENFPGVCLEAMAAGCGIVGTSVGGLPEMLSGERGLVVPPRDPARLAEAILTLLLDRPCRLALAARARASVRDDYSPARIAPLVESAYADAIARRPALR